MNSIPIIPGQFYLAEPEGDEQPQGWTIKAVLAGITNEETKERGLAQVWAIRNDLRTAAPELFPFDEIRHLVNEGVWKKVSGPVKPLVQVDTLNTEEKAKVELVQANRLALIQPILDLEADAYWPHVRRPALKAQADKTGKTADYLWQLTCLHWQFGGPEGLRPRCFLAGQKPLQVRMDNAEKAAKQARAADPKSKARAGDFFKPYKTGRKKAANVAEGKVMEWADIQTCRRAARKFLFVRSPDNKLRYNYSRAYEAMLDECYGAGEPQAHTLEVPSLDQFIAAVVSEPEFEKLSARIVGPFAAMRDHRPKKNTTQFEVLGPGHVLQVDDVSGKVILLHENTLMPIGTGNIFVGTDQWSKVIAGAHLTLEGTSYEGVKELFVNVATPKSAFFKEQEIEADPKYFPAHGVWRYCCPDKGPLGANLGNVVAREFCDLMNPGSHRPDMKSDIESSFHGYLRQHAERLPGYNRVERHNGNQDPNIIACLTPREFMKLWWEWAAGYNARVLDSYLPDEALRFPLKLRPSNRPFELFTWGLKNVSAYIREEPEHKIRRALLRHEVATLTPRNGIKLFKLRYFLDGTQPIRIKSIKVEAYFSAVYLKRIYVLLEGKMVTASLNTEDARKFGHLTVHEMVEEKKLREQSDRGGRSQGLLLRVHTSRARRLGVEQARNNIQSRFPDKDIRRMFVRGLPQAKNRADALLLEQEVRRAAEAKAFPAPSHQEAVPTPPIRLSRSKLLTKR